MPKMLKLELKWNANALQPTSIHLKSLHYTLTTTCLSLSLPLPRSSEADSNPQQARLDGSGAWCVTLETSNPLPPPPTLTVDLGTTRLIAGEWKDSQSCISGEWKDSQSTISCACTVCMLAGISSDTGDDMNGSA